jgi:cyclophilin family peptidyl-prolyl cis-trans isomerase
MKRPLAVGLTLLVALSVTSGALSSLAKDKERKPGLYATLDTTMGTIVLQLFEKEAPKTVANFVDLATGKKAWKDNTGKTVTGQPFYEGITFHRVIPQFMIQAGAHLADGGYRVSTNIADEIHPGLKHDRSGRLSMANAGPGTGSSQFFITVEATPWLDGKHAIFGQVVEGRDVVNKIVRVPRDASDKPRAPVLINKVTIERVGSDSAEKK